MQTPPELALTMIRAERARRSLRAFIRLAWPIVEPADPLISNWHIDACADHLEAVARGQIQNLLVNIPPGHGKSKVFGVIFPAWVWTWNPAWRAICASYAERLALRDAVASRELISSPWFRSSYSDPDGWRLKGDENMKSLYANTKSGQRQSTSVGGGGTGFRGNLVLADDPLNALDVLSKPVRDQVREWWFRTMSNRLNDPRRDSRVCVMQRLHADDLSAHILAAGNVEHLCLPSEFEPERRARTFYIVRNGHAERRQFFEDPRGERGELLFPQRYPAEVLQDEKSPSKLGEMGYAGQHQQRPSPPGGGMYKRAAWRFWKPDGTSPDHSASRPPECYTGPAEPLPLGEIEQTIISVDASFKKTVDGSFVAMHVWSKAGAKRFLRDRVHARMDFDESARALLSLIARWPDARAKIIEDKANGPAIISSLEAMGVSGLIAVSPEGGKEARAQAMLPYHAAGNVYLPDGAPWLDEYVQEHADFPLGATDDDVDAQSQALLHLEGVQGAADLWLTAFRQGNLGG